MNDLASSTPTSNDPPNQLEPWQEPGSLPLSDHRKERFANLLVLGMGPTDAHEKAGYSRNSGNAARLKQSQAVSQRVQWLTLEAAKLTIYDAAWIKDRLARHADALTRISVDPDTGEKIPGPMFNASAGNRALELLGKEHGMFKEKVELGGQVQVANLDLLRRLTPEERAAIKATLLAAAEREAPADVQSVDETQGVLAVDK